MRPHLIATPAALCLTLCLSGGAAFAQEARLSVTGEGVVSVEPDIAVLRMGVLSEGETPQAAVEGMSTALSPVLVGLIDDGIDAPDIQTGSLSLRPVYADRSELDQNTGPRITGYVAQSSLSVTVRALSDLGGVMSRAVASGSNTFDGLSWDLSDRQAAEDAALATAVADAARKAAVIAAAGGLALGPVVVIEERGGMRPGPVMMEARMAADVPVSAGSMDIEASVMVTYSLLGQ